MCGHLAISRRKRDSRLAIRGFSDCSDVSFVYDCESVERALTGVEETINQRQGCIYLGLISLAASGLGSVMAAVIFSMVHGGGSSEILLAVIIVLYFGGAIAIPIGLFVGIPMLAVSGGLMSRHIVFATLLFAIIGLLGGLVLKHVGGDAGLANAELIFGACVGGMHPLVYGRAKGVGKRTEYLDHRLNTVV